MKPKAWGVFLLGCQILSATSYKSVSRSSNWAVTQTHKSWSLDYHLTVTFLGTSVFHLGLNKVATPVALMTGADKREGTGN